MIAKNKLIHEIESLPAECIEEVMDFVGYIKLKCLKNVPETMLITEKVLAKDWNTAEEDAAWANL
ncbi:MAG: hypothetical protein LBT59_24040 [Clostridiales bacterium]|jgi:hypothetical protein|nr:hypothetical protein [Clostridiales bacterium]